MMTNSLGHVQNVKNSSRFEPITHNIWEVCMFLSVQPTHTYSISELNPTHTSWSNGDFFLLHSITTNEGSGTIGVGEEGSFRHNDTVSTLAGPCYISQSPKLTVRRHNRVADNKLISVFVTLPREKGCLRFLLYDAAEGDGVIRANISPIHRCEGNYKKSL